MNERQRAARGFVSVYGVYVYTTPKIHEKRAVP